MKCTKCGSELHHDSGRALCPKCWRDTEIYPEERRELEILTTLAVCVSEYRDNLSLEGDFILLEAIIVQLRYLLLMRGIPFKDFRK